jgi:hypothetical protein
VALNFYRSGFLIAEELFFLVCGITVQKVTLLNKMGKMGKMGKLNMFFRFFADCRTRVEIFYVHRSEKMMVLAA